MCYTHITPYNLIYAYAVGYILSIKIKKEEIWISPMTKAPSLTEKSKKQRDNTKTRPKHRLHNDYGLTQEGQLELQQPPNWCG